MKTFEKVQFKGKFRNYQQCILDNSDKYLLNGKINIVAAPGSGKTILGLELIKKLNSPAIILSPTTTIKYQWGDRFKDSFLDINENADDYFSYDLHEITLINSITYQALHSVMNKIPVEEDGTMINFSDLDIFELVRKYNVKTICLDEAHHLQNEWQQSLEKFLEQLGSDVKIIALTATPPYDASQLEWNRYEKVCGPIDEETFVPELIKEGTLCPHQDYIYFNYPTKEETVAFTDYKKKVVEAVKELRELDIFKKLYEAIRNKYNEDKESLFEDSKSYISLLIVINTFDIQIDQKIIKGLTTNRALPEVELVNYERAFQKCLSDAFLLTEEEKQSIVNILKKFNVLEKGIINFTLKDHVKHKLISSIGKLNSIAKITEAESNNLGDNLRLLILTDYIKKESIKDISLNKAPVYISVVTIFDTLRKSNPDYKMGVLSGDLIILPSDCKEELAGYKMKCTNIGDTHYSEFVFSSLKNKDKVDLVSSLFARGIINIIIGTKALLGEGWDSPCINTLILASFVGSFMLSNQMRGRAIRIDKNNPNKISNIWHLVTLEPEYIFEQNVIKSLAMKSHSDYSTLDSYDYETISRRFDCFVGPNYDTGEIESGIDRLTIVHPPYNQRGIEHINTEMLALATKRDDSKSKWENSLMGNFKVVEEMEVPIEKVVKPFFYVNTIGLIFSSGANALIGTFFARTLSTLSNNSGEIDTSRFNLLIAVLILLGLAFFVVSFFLGKLISTIIAHSSPKKNMTHFAKALLKTLQSCEMISHRASVKVKGNDFYIGIELRDATRYEQNMFNKALNEMFIAIDNPKYLLIMTRYGRLNYEESYSCPSILEKKKAMVELFSDHLKGRVGNFEIVYTRNDLGREVLLNCRKKSFLSKNEKMLKRKKILSKYE